MFSRLLSKFRGRTARTQQSRSARILRKRPNDRHLRLESLERRELMAADLIGVVRNGTEFLLDRDNDPAHEMDISFGMKGDTPVIGDWSGYGEHRPGAVRGGAANGLLRWKLDMDGNSTNEREIAFGLQGDHPVVGNWDAVGGDNVGVVRPGTDGLLHWYLDTDGDPTPELEFRFGLNGDKPVVGDWNGDGRDDQGVVRPGADGLLRWYLNTDTDVWPEDEYSFGLRGDLPVVGDWNGDGRDEVAVVRPGTNGLLRWYFNQDRDPDPESTLDYGLVGDQPVVGNWHMPEITLANMLYPGLGFHFGATRPNSPMPEKSFQVVNEGNAPLLIGNVQLPAAFQFVGTVPTQVAAGQSVTLTLAMRTTNLGEFTGDLTFTTNDGNETLVRIPLAGFVGYGHGSGGSTNPTPPTSPIVPIAEPEIDIVGVTAGASSPVMIGRANVNGSLSRTFWVHNRGSAPLAISRPARMPVGFQLDWRVPSELAPGAAEKFIVRMDTRLAGTKTGQFTILNSDRDEGFFTINVRAVVETPPPDFIGAAPNPVTPPQPGSPDSGTAPLPDTNGSWPTSNFGTVLQYRSIQSRLGTIVVKRVLTAGSNERLYADFYGLTGGLIVADQQVGNHSLSGLQRQFDVQALTDGSFAVSWTLQKLSTADIHFAVMDPYGRSLKTDRANISLGVQLDSSMVIATQTGFVVRWRNTATGNIWQRSFTNQGVATTGEYLV